MDDNEIDKILEQSEAIQKEMYSLIEMVKKTERGKNIPYEDIVTVFFFFKLAELQRKIESQFSVKLN